MQSKKTLYEKIKMKIIMVMVQSADGKIARFSSEKTTWSSHEDKKHFHEITKKHGAVIMGRTTFETLESPLPGRFNLVLTGKPDKSKNIPQLLEFYSGSPLEAIRHLESLGYTSAVLAGGSSTNARFLEENLVDEIVLTIEGLLFGKGLGMCDGLNSERKLEIISVRQLTDMTIIIHYRVRK
jgi:dihydrofolate reductase